MSAAEQDAPRFKVSIVTGYPTPSLRGHQRPGLTACVMDTWFGFQVVALFRSENRYGGNDLRTLGQDGAREAAEAKCAELNALELAHA